MMDCPTAKFTDKRSCGPFRACGRGAMMAKPRHLPTAAGILAYVDDQRRLAVRVVPGASADAIILPQAGAPGPLQVRITQIAEDGKANAALLALLAKALGVPKSTLVIIQGQAARTKVILLPE